MDRRTFLRGALYGVAGVVGATCMLGLAACGLQSDAGGSGEAGTGSAEEVIVQDAEVQWEAPAHIACVGDSITWGYGVSDTRDTESYPAQLAALLQSQGYGTQVDNFGYNGACALSNGKNPYRNVQEYYDSLGCDADLVILMLGTNDAVSIVWDSLTYQRELGDFIDAYQGMGSSPQVVLMVPPDLATTAFGAAYTDEKFDEMQQAVRDLASSRGLVYVDLEQVFAGRGDAWLTDGVHPNAEGNAQIAQAIVDVLSSGTTGK